MLAAPCVRLASRRAHLGSRAEGGGEPRSAPWLSYGAGVCLALAGFVMGAATAKGVRARAEHAAAIARLAHAAADWEAASALE